MSLYLKAWAFLAWTVLVLVTFPGWLPLLQTAFGPGGIILGVVLWLSHGLMALLLFPCPDCGLSLFKSSGTFFGTNHIWPNKICARCGRDHSA